MRVMGIALGVLVRNFGTAVTCSCASIRNIAFMTQTILLGSLFSAIWLSPFLMVLWRRNESAKWNSHGNISYFLGVQLNLVHPVS